MSCSFCVEKQRIVNIQQLHIGDHIEFGRICFFKTFLGKLCPSIREDLQFGYLYYHHAIVTEVNHVQRKIRYVEFTSAESSLSEFLRSKRWVIIRESELSFDKNPTEQNMFLVIHLNRGPNPPNSQEIVRNARQILQAQNERYHLLTNNCEHLANLCVTKHRVSLQILRARNITRRIIERIFTNPPSWFKRILKYMSRKLAYFMIRFQKVLKSMRSQKMYTAYANLERFIKKWTVSTLFIIAVFLAIELYEYYYTYKDNKPCEFCVRKWITKLVFKSLTMLLSKKILFLMAAAYFGGFLLYKYLSSNASYTALKSLETIEPGDVITYNLYMPFSLHDAIVVRKPNDLLFGMMRQLKRPFSSMNEQEVLQLCLSLIEDFFRKRHYPSVTYLDIHLKNNSEIGRSGSQTTSSLEQVNLNGEI